LFGGLTIKRRKGERERGGILPVIMIGVRYLSIVTVGAARVGGPNNRKNNVYGEAVLRMSRTRLKRTTFLFP
jgi:hypothetical protein